MPAKNSIKDYSPECFYHLYNRGVEKRLIFQDEQDYKVYLSYLKEYLLPKDENLLRQMLNFPEIGSIQRSKVLQALAMNNFARSIDLLCYSLMPNHFHLLLKQHEEDAIDKLMNSLGTRYTMYFNNKYERVGKLYQGVYKAVKVNTDEQLLHLSRYIHGNPFEWFEIPLSRWQEVSTPFSLPEYFGVRATSWVKVDEILSFFSQKKRSSSYLEFMEQKPDLAAISNLAIDSGV